MKAPYLTTSIYFLRALIPTRLKKTLQDINIEQQLILNSTKTPEIKLSIQYGLQQAQLDASALANGIYILVLTDTNNNVLKQKFVK